MVAQQAMPATSSTAFPSSILVGQPMTDDGGFLKHSSFLGSDDGSCRPSVAAFAVPVSVAAALRRLLLLLLLQRRARRRDGREGRRVGRRSLGRRTLGHGLLRTRTHTRRIVTCPFFCENLLCVQNQKDDRR